MRGLREKSLYFIFHSIVIDAEFEYILFTNFHLPSVSPSVVFPLRMLDPLLADAAAELRHPHHPALPSNSVYTRYYCEENAYLLAQAFYEQPSIREAWDIFVVFISNHTKTVCNL